MNLIWINGTVKTQNSPLRTVLSLTVLRSSATKWGSEELCDDVGKIWTREGTNVPFCA